MRKKPDTQPFKEKLLSLSSLTRRCHRHGGCDTQTDTLGSERRLSSMPIHMADIGSDNFEQEFTLSLMENDEETLDLIEAALERIEDGTYGSCTECGGRIPKTRLNAIPYTPHCIKCATEVQRR